jgi:hypothetical protein
VRRLFGLLMVVSGRMLMWSGIVRRSIATAAETEIDDEGLGSERIGRCGEVGRTFAWGRRCVYSIALQSNVKIELVRMTIRDISSRRIRRLFLVKAMLEKRKHTNHRYPLKF